MTERRSGQRKDRLIQTRVPQDLESTLKDEARRRRLSVSHLIRNVLEDTFNLVDNVVVEVDRVVSDGRHMAQTLRRDAERLRATAMGDAHARQSVEVDDEDEDEGEDDTASGEPDSEIEDAIAAAESALRAEAAAETAIEVRTPEPTQDLSHVYAWQPVVLNRPGECARCCNTIPKGDEAHMGLSDRPGPRAWLCGTCVEGL